MSLFYRTNNPCLCLVVATASAAALASLITYASKGFSSPSHITPSQWAWAQTLTPNLSSSPSNPKTDLYPTFSSVKMQKVILNLIDDLKTETRMRKGNKERDESMERVEAGLAGARALIRDAMNKTNHSSSSPLNASDYVPHGEIYINAFAFHRSYLLMEKLLKIFTYEEGEPPLFHYGPCKDIYSMEGVFLSFMETDKNFRTNNPHEAHLYFLPFSVVMILQHLFHPVVRDKAVLERVIGDYVRLISSKYTYWNRSLGADHFMLSCHDWGPRATWSVHQLYFTSIRLLCNANTSEFFNPRKDVSIPEINIQEGKIGRGLVIGLPSTNRTVLAFFAGQSHGHIRPALFQHWKEKDGDIRVYEKIPKGAVSYEDMMKQSKFCICPSGYEVASPRIAEAIYAECVPVIISKKYVLPFSDVLNWKAFSIQVSVSDIPDLKKILLGISEEMYLRMQERVRQVQRHFVVNNPPRRYDVYHMIVHSLWLRRLNLQIYG